MLYILISLTGFPLLWHRSNVRVILVSHIIDNYFAISSIYTGDKVCAHPSLDNSSRLLRIIRSKGTDVLYVGDPLLLQYTGNVKETFDELRTLLRGTWQIWTVINFCSRFWYWHWLLDKLVNYINRCFWNCSAALLREITRLLSFFSWGGK